MNKSIWAIAVLLVPLTGCVTVAEFRKLEREVIDLKRGGPQASGAPPRERLAELATRLEVLERESEQLVGRLEVAEHRSEQALEEARSARQASALPAAPLPGGGPPGAALGPEAAQDPGAGPDGAAAGSVSAEVTAYRAGYSQWRGGEWESCIDQFREFLQTYPSSAYADDAAYWLADCYFKQGDYKTAILRFDDVVTSYPEGNKAPEALYRQGEALLKLGPGFGKAAGKAFERVVKEYPRSGRATEAKRQLELLGTG
jgi:tol-pal system protein YbgF